MRDVSFSVRLLLMVGTARATVAPLGNGEYEYEYKGITGTFSAAQVAEEWSGEVTADVLRFYAERVAAERAQAEERARREAGESQTTAAAAGSTARVAADHLHAIFDLISAAPGRAHSTATSRSHSEPASKAASIALLQTDDDDDDDQVVLQEAVLYAANAAKSRKGAPDKGTTFDHFVGTWQLGAYDAAVVKNVEDAFASKLNAEVGGTWSKTDSVQERLQRLRDSRFKSSKERQRLDFPPAFEIKVTHPLVFAVLSSAYGALRELVADRELHLYTENAGDIENVSSHRNADAALFVLSGGAQSVEYGDAARRFSLLAVEAKRMLDPNGKSDALCGGERDFMWVSGREPGESMPVGTSLFTDGVSWFFARMAWRFDGRDSSWRREIRMSPEISLASDGGGWQLLAQWFVFAVQQAVEVPREPTGLSVCEWSETAWRLAGVMSVGSRSIVSRWRRNNDTVVVKFALKSEDAERRRKIHLYFEHERALLRLFADTASFVHLHAQFPLCDAIYTAMDDAGLSLAALDISGTAGRLLAKLIVKDIWHSALTALHARELCHFDITEHNIVVARDRQTAKLVDLESVTAFGKPTAGSPTAVSNGGATRPPVASKEFDQQSVCAVLKCLWDLAIASFQRRNEFVLELSGEGERIALINEISA